MSLDVLSQYVLNTLMLGMIYAMVAVGFTLFFGVLDVIKFSHGDVLMLGGFAALVTYLGAQTIGINNPWVLLLVMLLVSMAVTAGVGAFVARFLVLPLKSAPPLNTLLITLMFGLALRESVRLFYPNGSNPKPFPRLLPENSLNFGALSLRADSLILLAAGLATIVGIHLLITRTKLGLAIRAVAQACGAVHLWAGVGTGRHGRRDEWLVLQRDQLWHWLAAGCDWLFSRDSRWAGQFSRRHSWWFSFCSAADFRCSGATHDHAFHSQCL